MLVWASSNAPRSWRQRVVPLGGGTEGRWRWRRQRGRPASWVRAAMRRREPRRQNGQGAISRVNPRPRSLAQCQDGVPVYKGNVACEYCFEDKTNDFMSHEQLSIVIEKLLGHMERKAIASLTIYWQGGEIMLLPPAWFERAHELIQKAADTRGKRIAHSLQSNM